MGRFNIHNEGTLIELLRQTCGKRSEVIETHELQGKHFEESSGMSSGIEHRKEYIDCRRRLVFTVP